MMQSAVEFKRVQIRDLQDLQSPSLIAQRILEEASKDDIEVAPLARVIEQDPAVVARIIGVANSAFYGCPDKVFSVADAIIKVLGLDMVKNLAIGIAVSNAFQPERCKGFKLAQYWGIAIFTANLAQMLAAKAGTQNNKLKKHAYLCGLLHNLGFLGLVDSFPEEMADVFLQAESTDAEVTSQLQQDIIGINYLEAGSIIARKWHLPEDVVAVIEHLGDINYQGANWETTALISLSANLSAYYFSSTEWNSNNEKYMARLQLDESAVSTAFKKVSVKTEEIINLSHELSLGQ